jgi:Protein of unknown function (DUF2934)
MQTTGAPTDGALREEYRSAFGEYAAKLQALQHLNETESTDNRGIAAARAQVESARLAYNAARDRLAAQLARAVPTEADVRRTAQLLWEIAGRPQGSAERDWLTAEQLIGRAAVVCR